MSMNYKLSMIKYYALEKRRTNMASKAKGRESIILKCTVCGEETYITSHNKKKHPERFEVNKYCPRCNKMTPHKEKK